MPYIERTIRVDIATGRRPPQNGGELNYQITRNVVAYLGPKPSYRLLNEAIGALECAKLELYRRMAAPHEDAKCTENGDVYP